MPDPSVAASQLQRGLEERGASCRSVASSFRDPSGTVWHDGSNFLRTVDASYTRHYDHLMGSGLYQELVAEKLLLTHEELPVPAGMTAYKLLKPEQLRFISYPYEWCFSQWREAALATLRIQEMALERGMILKDASAFNMQFVQGRPVLIDTLSFEKLDAPEPWVAYGQFCRHFLAPLALMSFCDARLGGLMQTHLDGVPLDLASRLLPWRTRLRPWLLVHLHAHAASERRYHEGTKADARGRTYSLNSLRGLIASLQTAVRHLRPPGGLARHWAAYYDESVTGGGYVAHKKQVVSDWLTAIKPGVVWDLGANTGAFSRIAADLGSRVIAFDSDPACVEKLHQSFCGGAGADVLPLLLDLSNPTPALGWHHAERMSFVERPGPELVLALALIHHLAISHNVPLPRIAAFFADFSPRLIVEFVPKEDSNAQKLLRVRKDIFTRYTPAEFERAFGEFFVVEQSTRLADSERVLYRLTRRAVA